MTKFKQKNYTFPLMGAAMVGSGVISAVQGHNANAEAEEQTEEMQRHNKQMEKIAKDQGVYEKSFADDEKKSGNGLLKGLAAIGATAGALYGAKRGVFGAGAQKLVGKGMVKTGQALNGFNSTKGVAGSLINSGAETQAAGRMKQVTDTLAKNGKTLANSESIQNKVTEQIKNNALNGKTLADTNVGGFAKDMYNIHGDGIKKAAGLGASWAGLGYVGNRLAQSWKDHDEGNDKNTGKALAKIAGTAAAVGTGIWAAKTGKLGASAQNFMSASGTGGKALSSLGKSMNPLVRDSKTGAIQGKATAGKVAMNGLFVGMPVLGYAAQRGQVKEQSEAQANYSDSEGSGIGKKILGGLAVAGTVAGGIYGARRGWLGAGAQKAVGNKMAQAGSFLGKYNATKGVGEKLVKSGSDAYGTGMAKQIAEQQTKAGFKNWEKGGDLYEKIRNLQTTNRAAEAAKGASLKKGVSETMGGAMNWFGMMGTKSGTSAVQNTANKLAASDNKISKSIGEWMQKNPNAANIGAGAAAMAGGMGAMSVGDKAVKAVTKTVDNGAYDIEKEQNQKVYSKITFREKGEKINKETGVRTKFYKKKTKINEPGFKSESISISEKSFTKWDQTDQLKGMTDSDILAEKKKSTSSLNLGQSIGGAAAGSVIGGIAGKAIGNAVGKPMGGTGALVGAAVGGMAGMDKQTKEKTAIGAGLGAAAGIGLGLITKKPNLFNTAKTGALIGGTAGVISGVASGRKQNKENQFFNDRLEYAQNKALKREKADWKDNMNNREGYSR